MITFSNTTSALSKNNSNMGIAFTLLLIGLGIYVGVKHYRTPGFWMGVLALFLLSSSVYLEQKPQTTT